MTRLPRKLNRAVSGGQLTEAGRLNPSSLGITLNMIPLHRVSMTLREDDLPLQIHDLVEVYNHNGSVGVYQVASIGTTYRKERKVELTHGLDMLSSSCFSTIEKYSGTVAGMLQKIIAAQTQTINGVACWVLGTVEDTNPWNKEIEYDNLMECLTEIARTEEDYRFDFDMSAFPWVLNFVRRDSAVLSEFRLGHNTETCQITADDGDLCTRLYLSVTTENSESVTDKDGQSHSIVTTEEGYYTFNDAAAQAIYGVVAKTAGVNRADVPTEAALNAWVAGYFSRHNAPALQIAIDGEEFNRITGCSIDEMHLGRLCRVALPDYASTFNERIVSVQYPDALRQESRVKVSLANKKETAEGSFAKIREAAAKGGRGAGKAKKTADNAVAEQERQKIIYDLQVQKDERRFSIIATESEWNEMEQAYETTHSSYYEQTAREIAAKVATSTYTTEMQLKADKASLISQINACGETTPIAYGKLEVQPGSVLIKAINGGGSHSSIALEADVIDIAGLVTALEAWNIQVLDLTAEDVTINGSISGHLVGDVEGNIDGDVIGENHTGYFQSGLYVGPSLASVGSGIADAQVVPITGTNDYKLQIKRYGDSSWTDAGTFNTAAAGWAAAAAAVDWPDAGSGSSFRVTVPDTTEGDTTGKTFTLDWSGNYVYANDGTNNVARKSITGSISATTTSSQPGGTRLRTVTVGTTGNKTYVTVNASGRRNSNDYIQIEY